MSDVVTIPGNGLPAGLGHFETPSFAGKDGQTGEGASGEVFVWHGGRKYEMSPPHQSDYDAAIDRLKQRKLDPLDALIETLDGLDKRRDDLPLGVAEEIRKRFTERAYAELATPCEDRTPTREELAQWIDMSSAGKRFMFFRMLLRKAPDLTEEMANVIYDAAAENGYLEAESKIKARLKAQREAKVKKE